MTIPKISPYSLDEANTPIDNQVQWKLDCEKTVVLVHDMQAYFANFYDLDKEPMSTAINNIGALLKVSRNNNVPVIYTAQPVNQTLEKRALLTDFWGEGLKDHHHSHNILPEIAPQTGEKIYTKWRYSAFQKTSLNQDLKERNKSQLIICGVYAHIGILSTALDGFMKDYQCFVVEDAIADFSAQDQAMARRWIAGRCGMVINCSEAILQINQTELNGNKTKACGSDIDIERWVSELLETPIRDIQKTDNLADWGMDSMRLMTIVDRLKVHHIPVDFLELAKEPTLASWNALLAEHLR